MNELDAILIETADPSLGRSLLYEFEIEGIVATSRPGKKAGRVVVRVRREDLEMEFRL
jgi:hypothetical protein